MKIPIPIIGVMCGVVKDRGKTSIFRKNSFMSILKQPRKEHRALYYLLFTSFFAIIVVDFYFIDVPETFKYGYELGRLVSNMSMAYVSSFIFYIVIFSFIDSRKVAMWAPIKKDLIAQLVKVHSKLFNTSKFMMVYTLEPIPGYPPDYFYNLSRAALIKEFNKLEAVFSHFDLTVDPLLATKIIECIADIEEALYILHFFSCVVKPEYSNAQFINESPLAILEKIDNLVASLGIEYTGIIDDPANGYNGFNSIDAVKEIWNEAAGKKDRIFFDYETYAANKKVGFDYVVMQEHDVMRVTSAV
jgi:hypothetical protein